MSPQFGEPIAYACTPFAPTGFCIPAIEHRDGHVFYCHCEIPPILHLIPREQRLWLYRRAAEQAQAGLQAMIDQVFGGACHA